MSLILKKQKALRRHTRKTRMIYISIKNTSLTKTHLSYQYAPFFLKKRFTKIFVS